MKTAAIIQARMGSARLPGKIVKTLPFGQGAPILNIIIAQLKSLAFIDQIIVATSTHPENDTLANIVAPGITFFRGSEDNVLERFYKAAVTYQVEQIIRITADNPIVALEQLTMTWQWHRQHHNEYTNSTGLPLGTNCEIFSFQALTKAVQLAANASDREHVTPVMIREPRFRKSSCHFKIAQQFPRLRLTVDYPADYALMNLLFTASGGIPSFGQVLELVARHPWLQAVNAHHSL